MNNKYAGTIVMMICWAVLTVTAFKVMEYPFNYLPRETLFGNVTTCLMSGMLITIWMYIAILLVSTTKLFVKWRWSIE